MRYLIIALLVIASVAAATPVFQDGLEAGTIQYAGAGQYGWIDMSGRSARHGTGYNGSFVADAEYFVSGNNGTLDYTGVPRYFLDANGNVIGPFTVTSNTKTTLYFTGDATSAVYVRGTAPVVSSERDYSGNHSLKFIFDPNCVSTANDSAAFDDGWSEARFQLGANLSEVWFEFMLYMPPDYYQRRINGADNNKFFMFWRDSYYSSDDWSGGFQTYPSVDHGGAAGTSFLWPGSTTSTNSGWHDIEGGPQVMLADNAYTPGTYFQGPNGPLKAGAWNRVRIHLKAATAPLAYNGVMEMWANYGGDKTDTLIFQKNNGDFYGTLYNTINQGYLLGWANSGFTNETNFYIDDFKIYDTDPGWTDTTPPTTPLNLTASTISSSQINLAWSASTDNIGVADYRIIRNGTQIASTTSTVYNDTGLAAATMYIYQVIAYDAAGNPSNQSSVQGTTQTPSDEPTDPGSGYLWQDNFNRYASIMAMRSPGNCAVGTDGYGIPDAQTVYGDRTKPYWGNDVCTFNTHFSLVTGRGGIGNAIRAHYDDDPTGLQINGFQRWISPTDSSDGIRPLSYNGTLIMQTWFRFPRLPGATGFIGSEGMKWFEMLYNDGSGDRIQFGDHGTWHFNPGSATGNYPNGGELGHQPVGPYPAALNDGNWHRMTIAYRPNTMAGQGIQSSRDGFARAWIDGTKVVDVSASAAGITPPGGTKVWCTIDEVDAIGAAAGHQILFLRWPELANSVDGAFDLDHDDLKLWTLNGTNPSSPSQRPGDLNDDNKVDFLDLLIVVGQFRHSGATITNTRADINGDGTVNLFDFVLLAKNWGKIYS